MKNNRIGIILVVSSLAVIALIVAMLLQRQQADAAAQLRVQGLATIRSLSALPATVLVPRAGQYGVLDSVLANGGRRDFAYAAVTDAGGRNLAEVAGPGVLVPPAVPMALSGFSERVLAPTQDMPASVREFHGPVADPDGARLQIRIGYYEPRIADGLKDLPFYGLVALAVFLLVPLIYLVIKREMAPLAKLGEQLHSLGGSQGAAALPATREQDVKGLALELNSYLDQAGRRIRELEESSVANLASGRLLEYTTNKMQAMLHCQPDGLLALDPGGDITFATAKLEPLLGVPVTAVLTQPVDTWCEDAELRAVLQRLRSGAADTRRPLSFEFTPVRVPDKRLHASVSPLHAAGGAVSFGSLVVLRDVTAEHLARAAGNDFVAHVSHELKSPLNVLSMYGELLADPATGPDQRIEAVNVVQDQIERMTSLVNNLLNVSKLEMGNVRPERHRVKLHELLHDTWLQAQPRAQQKKVKLELQVPQDIPAVSIDKDLFRIALNNLVGNAIKYNDAGGSVVLAAEEGDSDVVITVRDTGIGMALEDQARVTEKFYRVRETGPSQRGGHGLGLYLANQIVELHHGRLTLESQPGQGSTFSIHLKKMPSLAESANVL
ncbi:ATP-binding protein [Massilia sp. 9I]|uniref:sensor histidine kinase n=1 Tax=Massilia sp. 9I TaxID=2653152 RepID=UPI0012F47308|nr:ATP-binding protein [Massilia sp. 9I]VXC28867.1 putative Histidine kinase [Massilia sp. 9I]